MSNTEEINVYFRRTDIQAYNTLILIPFFSDLQFDNNIGQVITVTNLVQYSEGINLDTFNSKIWYFYFDNDITNKKDSITADFTGFDVTTKIILNPGFFIYQIIAGQGKYLGARGTVYLYLDENLIYYVKIIVHY